MGSYETAIIIPVDDCWLRVGVNIFNVQSSVSTSRCTISTSATWTPSMGWRMITSRSPTRYSAGRSSRRQRASQTATFASAGSRFRPKIRCVQAVEKRTSLAIFWLLYSWFTNWCWQTSAVQQRISCSFFPLLVHLANETFMVPTGSPPYRDLFWGSILQHPQTLLGCVRTSASSLSLSNQS